MKIKKLLIANRGEIAIRILRSCKELGIQTVSVHSDVDEDSLHVKLADESVCIGSASPTKSYLNMHAILSAADITGADAIHPGYGFLAENHEFAELCYKSDVTFVGPSAKIIHLMGDKIRSKEVAKKANVPVLKSIIIEKEITQNQIKDIEDLGFPVLIKSSAGGGGKGMRIVQKEEDLIPFIKVLKSEALAAFGNDQLFVEKYIEKPRHIEVQVLCDGKNYLHIGERDCSIQRKFQKVIEEAPAQILSKKKREEVWGLALKIAKEVKYDSVGTVEFLYDQDSGKFYFMEMNTRIQVEHPVSEMISLVDLIKQQIKIANNENLLIKQEEIKFNGHSIECRINAEDPKSFLPSPGKIDHYHRAGGLGVRVDDFIYTGYKVKPFYDSMISKVIVHAESREAAVIRMRRALNEIVVGGIKTNIPLHLNILNDSDFQQNKFDTSYLKNKRFNFDDEK